MVKFSKQLELQLVPEWRAAFCDYWKLKKDLKRLKDQGLQGVEQTITNKDLPTLTRRKPFSSRPPVIKVHHYKASSQGTFQMYETQVMEPLCNVSGVVTFFKALDEELNKVNSFYASKEEEFTRQLETLKHQLINLVGLKEKLEDQCAPSSSSLSFVPSSMGLYLMPQKSSTNNIPKKSLLGTNTRAIPPHGSFYSQNGCMEYKAEMIDVELTTFFDEENELGFQQDDSNETNGSWPVMKPLVPPHKGTPSHDMSHCLWGKIVLSANQPFKKTCKTSQFEDVITKKKMHHAKKMLRAAFVEFYRGLGLLKSFSSLNICAFEKMLKKHDKVTQRNASLPYLEALECSRLNNSTKIDQLMDEAERLFTMYFAKNDQKKAIMLLKPAQQKVCHTTTYFTGLFSGWSISFMVSFFLMLYINDAHTFKSTKLSSYVENAYPMYSMFLLILLHMYLYGWNVHLWRKMRINYPFIFEFAPRSELRSGEILLGCTSLTTLVAASMVNNLILFFHESTWLSPNAIPFATFMVWLILIACPFNVLHRSSRFFFLKCMKRIVLAPFYKVMMADFFLADQLTSQMWKTYRTTIAYISELINSQTIGKGC